MTRSMDCVEAAPHAQLSLKEFIRQVRAGLPTRGYRLDDGEQLWSADDIDLAMRR